MMAGTGALRSTKSLILNKLYEYEVKKARHLVAILAAISAINVIKVLCIVWRGGRTFSLEESAKGLTDHRLAAVFRV